MNKPSPDTSSHLPEMVVATVAGVAFAMKTGHYLAGIVLGIALGVVLSLIGTTIRARNKR